MKAPWAPTLPMCRECKAPNPRVVSKRVILGVTVVDGAASQTETVAHEWLCASCEYKRERPDAAPFVTPLPRERRPASLQEERLW